jgi:hypothetical protein
MVAPCLYSQEIIVGVVKTHEGVKDAETHGSVVMTAYPVLLVG